jgi:hypothetical protein
VPQTRAGRYSRDSEVELKTVEAGCAGWEQDRHHFRLIISAETADKIYDLDSYLTEAVKRLSLDLKELNLNWVAISHFDTDQPHTHVLIRGKRANSKNLPIPRAHVSHGLRERAQEQAQVILGDISRSDPVPGLFSRSIANRWTDIDFRLTALDVELARRGQSQGHSVNATNTFARKDLEARAVYLVQAGYAQRQGHGVGFKPDVWAKLRDADVALALERHLIISSKSISQSLNEGVTIGNIAMSIGKQTVSDRGVGVARAPATSGQELSIGHVIGTGLER